MLDEVTTPFSILPVLVPGLWPTGAVVVVAALRTDA